MDQSQKRFVIESVKKLSARDFETVLRYYNVPIVRKSILCIWHDDKNYGSCYLTKDGSKAYCFACQRPIDAVDIVMHEEGLDYVDAAERVWVGILGNPMPPGETADGREPVATAKELEFLGLYAAGGGYAERYVNACPRCDEADGSNPAVKAWNGALVLKGDPVRNPPILRLLETNPEVAAAILEGKANDAVAYYERLEKDLDRKSSYLYSLVKALPHEDVVVIRSEIVAKLRKAKAIRKKIRNRQ